jgi:hypothetical protein
MEERDQKEKYGGNMGGNLPLAVDFRLQVGRTIPKPIPKNTPKI